MEENNLNNNELPKEIQADNDNTNPLLDIIATLQEKLDNNNQNISNNTTNTSTNTYSSNSFNNFSQNQNKQTINTNNISYDYTQNQNKNNTGNNGFDMSKIFEMLNGFSGSSHQSTASASNPFMNIDMDTMMRVGKIFSSMNKEDPRKNLLLSLKPFLRDNRQKNVDTYIFILGILNVLDSFSNGDSVF